MQNFLTIISSSIEIKKIDNNNPSAMKHHIHLQLSVILLSSCLAIAHAQTQDEKLTREMTLEREYDPTVQDANKVNRLPELKEPEVTRRTIEYSPFTIPANPEKHIYILPSGDIMTEIPVNQRRGYLHLGGGMLMNLSGDFGYHFINNEKDKLNFYLSHRSANRNVKYVESATPSISGTNLNSTDYIDYRSFNVNQQQKAKFNDNLVGIDYKHYFAPAVLRLGGNFEYDAFNYYGLPFGLYNSLPVEVTDSLADRSTNQVNQSINAYAGIQSKEDAGVGYHLDFDFLRFDQKYGVFLKTIDGLVENKYTIRAGLSFPVGSGNKRLGLDAKMVMFNMKVPFSTNPIDFTTVNYVDVMATPYFQMSGDNWKAKLGVNIMYVDDNLITNTYGDWFVAPNVSLEAEVSDQTVFYVDATSAGVQPNDPYQLSKQNRYIVLHYPTASKTWLDGIVGIRSGIVPGFWFDLFAGYSKTNYDAFFVPIQYPIPEALGYVTNPPAGFVSYYNVIWANSARFKAGASLKYMYRKWVDFSLSGVYNTWSFGPPILMDGPSDFYKNAKAYGRPAVEINADLTVKPLEPLTISLNYYLGADRYTFFAGRQFKLNNLHDLTFKASWNFNETFGAYLKLNNLLFQQQELWYGYPLQGFNAMAGVNLNF